jgi:hypothetical protein
VFLASLSLPIGNVICSNLPIIILRYCAETVSKNKFINSPGIPTFVFFEKCKNPGSLTRAQYFAR